MTTIAWDGTFLATDSGLTIGAHVQHAPVRKLWTFDGRVDAIAVNGDYQTCLELVEWASRGCPESARPNAGEAASAVLIIGRKAFVVEGACRLMPVTWRHYARGYGFECAMGALFAGNNARLAVRAAVKHIQGHALPVQWYNAVTGEFSKPVPGYDP